MPPAEASMVVVAASLWLVAGLAALGWLPLAGLFPLDLYPFYSFATVWGWLAGNFFVRRRRRLIELGFRKLPILAYLFGPPSALFLLRMLTPLQSQQAAPLVPLFGLGIYLIFFLVPVTLKQPSDLGRRDVG